MAYKFKRKPDLETLVAEQYDPNENYPLKGEPHTALIISLDCDRYEVLAHTGRYFHGQIECVGFNGEDIGISNMPDKPGIWFMDQGKPWFHRDWETGIVDDYGIEGGFRKATFDDFLRMNVECPIDL